MEKKGDYKIEKKGDQRRPKIYFRWDDPILDPVELSDASKKIFYACRDTFNAYRVLDGDNIDVLPDIDSVDMEYERLAFYECIQQMKFTTDRNYLLKRRHEIYASYLSGVRGKDYGVDIPVKKANIMALTWNTYSTHNKLVMITYHAESDEVDFFLKCHKLDKSYNSKLRVFDTRIVGRMQLITTTYEEPIAYQVRVAPEPDLRLQNLKVNKKKADNSRSAKRYVMQLKQMSEGNMCDQDTMEKKSSRSRLYADQDKGKCGSTFDKFITRNISLKDILHRIKKCSCFETTEYTISYPAGGGQIIYCPEGIYEGCFSTHRLANQSRWYLTSKVPMHIESNVFNNNDRQYEIMYYNHIYQKYSISVMGIESLFFLIAIQEYKGKVNVRYVEDALLKYFFCKYKMNVVSYTREAYVIDVDDYVLRNPDIGGFPYVRYPYMHYYDIKDEYVSFYIVLVGLDDLQRVYGGPDMIVTRWREREIDKRVTHRLYNGVHYYTKQKLTFLPFGYGVVRRIGEYSEIVFNFDGYGVLEIEDQKYLLKSSYIDRGK